MARQVAAIFAHPDDEVLGAGATIARLADAGAAVRILILSTGLLSRGGGPSSAIDLLRDQARAAAKVLGAVSVEFADFPDNRMDSVALHEVVQRVETFLTEPPDTVLTHHSGDLNIDHRIVHQAVLTACRPLPPATDHEILAGEVNSSTEWATRPLTPFEPDVFFDVDATLQRKLDALACYTGEVRDWPHPRSLEGVRTLARMRGMQCGAEAAEAFMLVRKFVR